MKRKAKRKGVAGVGTKFSVQGDSLVVSIECGRQDNNTKTGPEGLQKMWGYDELEAIRGKRWEGSSGKDIGWQGGKRRGL